MKMKNTQVGGEPGSTLEYADVCQDNFKTILPFLNLYKEKPKLLQKSQCICFMYAANENLQASAKAIRDFRYNEIHVPSPVVRSVKENISGSRIYFS